jgi:anion-transporting  ArsA/GET3 family ATPase
MTGMDVTGIDPITQQALESRSKAVSRLSGIDTSQLADMLTNGQIMSGSQAMRDLKRFDPDKYLALQQQLTKKNQLTSINAVATGGKLATNLTQQMDTALDNGISEILSQNFGDESAVAGEDFANYLGNNARFANYRQQMDNIMGQIGALDTKIENLRKDAIAHLGADVSEYQISSYINVR